MVSPEKGWRGAQPIRCEAVLSGLRMLSAGPRLGNYSSITGSGISHALEGDARRFLDGIYAHAPTGL